MDDRKAPPEKKYIVPALAQGLSALALFSRDRPMITPPEIAQELLLSRATVFRMLNTLESLGYVVRDDRGRHYRLGPAVLGRGFAYLASFDVVEIAQPILQKLRDETGMSSHMAIRDGAEVVYISRFAARTTIASSVQVGTRFPAHATVLGRMLLCELSEGDLKALYSQSLLPQFSQQTPASLAALHEFLAADRARGYAISQSFFENGVNAIAAPIRDKSNRIIAAINITAVGAHVTMEEMNGALKDAVVSAAAQISQWIATDHTIAAPVARGP